MKYAEKLKRATVLGIDSWSF